MRDALLVLDAPALYYRAFYALPTSLRDPQGRPINAVRGLLDTVASLCAEAPRPRVIAAFDADWRPAFRTEIVPAYKAQRIRDTEAGTETPEELIPQISVMRRALAAAGIPIAEVAGTEADDVIASIAAQAEGPVTIVSPDRDLLALLEDERVVLRRPRPKGEWEFTAAADLPGLYGVAGPALYRELAALRGDPSDGLSGAPGIGEKTAAKLLAAYGDLDGVLAAAHAGRSDGGLTPKRRAALVESEAAVRANVRVMTCLTDLDVAGWLAQAQDIARRTDRAALAELGREHGVAASAARLGEAVAGLPPTGSSEGSVPTGRAATGREAAGFSAESARPAGAHASPVAPSAAPPSAGLAPEASAPTVQDRGVPSGPAARATPSSEEAQAAEGAWPARPVWGFDLETTGVDAHTARIVTAALVAFDHGARGEAYTWLADPGIAIPAAATAVHGISTERAREEGMDRRAAVEQLCAAIADVASAGGLLAGHNIAYDLTVLQAECERLSVVPTAREVHPPVLDTLVLDRRAEKYRRGPRVLQALAERWGVELHDAHSADADAAAAAQIAFAIGAACPEIGELSPTAVHAAQVAWKAEQAADLQRYLRAKRDPQATVSQAWPFEERGA